MQRIFPKKKNVIKGQTKNEAPIPHAVRTQLCSRPSPPSWCFRPGAFRESQCKVPCTYAHRRALATQNLTFVVEQPETGVFYRKTDTHTEIPIAGHFRPFAIVQLPAGIYSLPNRSFGICRVREYKSTALSQPYSYYEPRVFTLLGTFRARASGTVLAGAVFAQNTEVRNYGSYTQL